MSLFVQQFLTSESDISFWPSSIHWRLTMAGVGSNEKSSCPTFLETDCSTIDLSFIAYRTPLPNLLWGFPRALSLTRQQRRLLQSLKRNSRPVLRKTLTWTYTAFLTPLYSKHLVIVLVRRYVEFAQDDWLTFIFRHRATGISTKLVFYQGAYGCCPCSFQSLIDLYFIRDIVNIPEELDLFSKQTSTGSFQSILMIRHQRWLCTFAT